MIGLAGERMNSTAIGHARNLDVEPPVLHIHRLLLSIA
jgi:hypothetical protein